MKQTGISAATKFTPNGIIPPAITGMHNGDAIRAWHDGGITNVVGDNTRPSLMNQKNEMWPLYSTVSSNGFAGMLIIGRWATNIYYNVIFLSSCTVKHLAHNISAIYRLARSWSGSIPQPVKATTLICSISKGETTFDICLACTTTHTCSIKQT